MPTAFTPSLKTLTQMQALVLNYFQARQDNTTLNSQVTQALNSGIGRINARNWKTIVGDSDVNLVAGTAKYTMASIAGGAQSFKSPMILQRINASSQRDGRIPFLDYQSMMTEYPYATSSGDPEYYTIDHITRQLILSVPPSAAYVAKYPTLNMIYYARANYLADSADTTAINPEFDWFLIWYARSEMAEQRGDTRKADRAAAQAELLWNELKRDDTNIVTDWPF